MENKKKPNTNPKKEVEKIFRRMADQLEEAGDRCRIKKGGPVCASFDATADVFRRAPRYFDPSALDGMAEAPAESGMQLTAPAAAPAPAPPVPAPAAPANIEAVFAPDPKGSVDGDR